MSNVHFLHVARKAGRRRETALPDVPLADVVDIADYRDDAFESVEETAEERADRLEALMDELSHHLLMAIRTVKKAPGPKR
ncbi:hypothetical protein [Caballeronia sordidicola]|uniref:hypothetical protein n=1 Tax=Caballeronia sordidicola TaxID=196367 RepID=UPI000A383C43|nr:hypothetical protein [Caballeronia sordidicola]